MYASRASQLKHFNSIKVRLEQISEISENDIFDDFNSIKVRLEHFSYGQLLPGITFQFHKGTIRTAFYRSQELLSSEFQFHKGTIRTLFTALRSYFLLNFNSVKVRLEQVISMVKLQV